MSQQNYTGISVHWCCIGAAYHRYTKINRQPSMLHFSEYPITNGVFSKKHKAGANENYTLDSCLFGVPSCIPNPRQFSCTDFIKNTMTDNRCIQTVTFSLNILGSSLSMHNYSCVYFFGVCTSWKSKNVSVIPLFNIHFQKVHFL